MSEQLLQQILNELKGVKSEITDMKSEITDMKSEITDMKSEISSIKKDTVLIPLIQQAVSEVNAEVIATRDAAQHIDETLRGHEVTLDLLSRRSIDQEAALKRIK